MGFQSSLHFTQMIMFFGNNLLLDWWTASTFTCNRLLHWCNANTYWCNRSFDWLTWIRLVHFLFTYQLMNYDSNDWHATDHSLILLGQHARHKINQFCLFCLCSVDINQWGINKHQVLPCRPVEILMNFIGFWISANQKPENLCTLWAIWLVNQNWPIKEGDRKHSFWQLVGVQGSGFNFVKISELQLLLCESLKRGWSSRENCLISDRLLRIY